MPRDVSAVGSMHASKMSSKMVGISKLGRKMKHLPVGKEPAPSLAKVREAMEKTAAASTANATATTTTRRPNTQRVTARKMMKLQERTRLLMPGAPFRRYVQRVCREMFPDLRFAKDALLVFQEGVEYGVYIVAVDAKRINEQNGKMLLGGDTLDMAAELRGI